MDENWEILIHKFRKLGGLVENIDLKKGEFGRGIFSINPNKKAQIFIPRNLMIKINDIDMNKNKLFIKEKNHQDKDKIEFFNFYLDKFSLDFKTREEIYNFEKNLILFSSNIKLLIKKYLFLEIKENHEGSLDKTLLNSFIESRKFRFYGSSMICPILDLINHKVNSKPFLISKNGIKTPNYKPFNGELTHNYGCQGSIKRFFQYKFISLEPKVFSFPFSIKLNEEGIILICKGNDTYNKILSVKKYQNKIIIDGLLIADKIQQELPSQYFRKLLKNINIPSILYREVIKYNLAIRKMMKKELKYLDNKTSKNISEILDYEIGLIISNLEIEKS